MKFLLETIKQGNPSEIGFGLAQNLGVVANFLGFVVPQIEHGNRIAQEFPRRMLELLGWAMQDSEVGGRFHIKHPAILFRQVVIGHVNAFESLSYLCS